LNQTPTRRCTLAIEAQQDSGALNQFTLAEKHGSIVFEAKGTIEWHLPDPPSDLKKCD
jgi:hypothetical protein